MIRFFYFILWAQYLLFKDLIRGLWTHKFQCNTVEKNLVDYLEIRTINISDQSDSQNNICPKIIFANHRSFTDFFLDSFLVGGASNLSRYMVALALPIVGLYGSITGRGLFFNRARAKRSSLEIKILSHLKKYTNPLIIYPEGTRYLGENPIPLRHGVLRITYENNIPCQILIAKNKEHIVDEKSLSIKKNCCCVYMLSQSISPHSFDSYEMFYQHITAEWKSTWEKVYRHYVK